MKLRVSSKNVIHYRRIEKLSKKNRQNENYTAIAGITVLGTGDSFEFVNVVYLTATKTFSADNGYFSLFQFFNTLELSAYSKTL